MTDNTANNDIEVRIEAGIAVVLLNRPRCATR